jgi:SAM-dependent methyltransferase
MVKHAEQLVTRITRLRELGPQSLVVEVASNDGYLLQYYLKAGIRVLGIEPALNVAQTAERERGIPTLSEFFDQSLAEKLALGGQQADVVHAHNVLAHVANLNDVVRGFHTILKDEGIAIIEVPYVRDLIEQCEFDTIYHEHLCYFSLTALDRLFTRHGLVIADVERISIHGGSLRVIVQKSSAASRGEAVQNLIRDEQFWGVERLGTYEAFATRVQSLKSSLVNLLRAMKEDGKTLAAYGAAAKGSTLLNYAQIGSEALDFVVDRSPHKQGRYLPGVHLAIYPPSKLLEVMPDYVLLLAWNFANEIIDQLFEYRQRGGQIIIPVPQPSIV